MSTPPLKAAGRTLAEFEAYVHTDGQPLWPAERKLLEAVRKGEVCDLLEHGRIERELADARSELGPDQTLDVATEAAILRPRAKTDDNHVRPGFLRFLILGGDERAPVHERGAHVQGAWIEGVLDLDGVTAICPIFFVCGVVAGSVFLVDASIVQLGLDGSRIASLRGDRLKARGSVFLRKGFVTKGTVRLLGAEIGGDLNCRSGRFTVSESEPAVFCDGARITGSVNLNRGFVAEGEVRLLGAEIGGNLECSGGWFTAKGGGNALSCDSARVAGSFLFRKEAGGAPTMCSGSVSLTRMEVGLLCDDVDLWPRPLDLDGFIYGGIVANSSHDPKKRIAWLDKNLAHRPDIPFSPKPWEQLIKVLRASGHEAEARQIAMAKEDRMRLHGRIPWPVSWLHWVFGLLAGYGYAPFRLVGVLVGVWLACAAFFLFAAEQGVFAPTNPLVFNNLELAKACNPDEPRRVWPGLETSHLPGRSNVDPKPPDLDALQRPVNRNWYLCPDLPSAYTTFDALIYSLDLLLPLVELQQDKDWAPMICTPEGVRRDRDWFGAWLESILARNDAPVCQLRSLTRFVMWFEILFGWVASLMLVAAVSRVATRDRG